MSRDLGLIVLAETIKKCGFIEAETNIFHRKDSAVTANLKLVPGR